MNRVLSICHLLLLSILLQHKEIPVGSNPSGFTSAVQINPERERGLFPKTTADGCRKIETVRQAQPVSMGDVIRAGVPAPQKCSYLIKCPGWQAVIGVQQQSTLSRFVAGVAGQRGVCGRLRGFTDVYGVRFPCV